ncbi:MAG: response regulator [Planctomycetota bacterium]
MSLGNTVSILLVDDDQIDVESIRRSFKKQKIANPITVAKDGLEALAILRGEADGETIDRPYLILLDLNMPRMGGIEFLKTIRDDEELKKSVVFVLTTSDDDRDVVAAYENQVAGYMVKSRVGEDFVEMIGMLDHYWRVIEFPI